MASNHVPKELKEQAIAALDTGDLYRMEKAIFAILPPAISMPILKKAKAEYEPEIWPDIVRMFLEEVAELTNPFKTKPVDMQTFLFSPFYLNIPRDELVPETVKYLEEMNSGFYVEAVLTGAIGVGKSTLAVLSMCYQLYLLSCYESPHRVLGQKSTDEIVFIIQSATESISKKGDYERIKANIDASPYFKQKFPYDHTLKSEMHFPGRIIVRPVAGTVTGAIGQNVYACVLEEANFMATTEQSKNSRDGGSYDQAWALYNSLVARRKSRFLKKGRLPGIFIISSSRNYPGQFTDKKEEEAKRELAETGKTTIYIYDKVGWEVFPGRYSGEFFPVFVGNQNMNPKIIRTESDKAYYPEDQIKMIPVEHRPEFENDIMAALRDVAGVATLALYPFIMRPEKVSEAMERGYAGCVSREDVDFETTKIKIFPDRFVRPERKHFAHLDLAISSDSAGLSVGHVAGWKKVMRGETMELLPVIHIDIVLEIKPPPAGEIIFSKVREVLYVLKKLGMNIRWVTLDSFQSQDTLQILRQNGFLTAKQSIDVSTLPYEVTKTAFYDDRIIMPPHEKVRYEFASLEKDQKKGKVDHPPNGSKDCADAVAGVVYGLTMRKETWMDAGIPPANIPDSVKNSAIDFKGAEAQS
jgi:hypothetical protein